MCEKMENYHKSPKNLQLNQQMRSYTEETHDSQKKICVLPCSAVTKH